MKRDNAIENLPRTQFCINDPKLDTIALKIIWGKDQELWKNFVVRRYSVFDSVHRWNSGKIRKLLKQIYLDSQFELLQAQQNFRSWWNAVEGRWYLFLRDFFEVKIERKVCFNVHVGISPISPRDINNEGFLLPLCASRRDVLRICAHETSHFFFYRRIKEIKFVIQPNKQHLWLISEVLVPLLFRDSRSINILGKMPQGSYICKQSFIERCRGIYQERLKGKISSAELIEHLLRVEINTEEEELDPKFLS